MTEQEIFAKTSKAKKAVIAVDENGEIVYRNKRLTNKFFHDQKEKKQKKATKKKKNDD